jgi:hypothetical protein
MNTRTKTSNVANVMLMFASVACAWIKATHLTDPLCIYSRPNLAFSIYLFIILSPTHVGVQKFVVLVLTRTPDCIVKSHYFVSQGCYLIQLELY